MRNNKTELSFERETFTFRKNSYKIKCTMKIEKKSIDIRKKPSILT